MFYVKPTPTKYNKYKHTLVSSTGERTDFSIYQDGDNDGWYQDLGMDTEFQAPGNDNFCNTPTKKELITLIENAANRRELSVFNHETNTVIFTI